MSLMINRHQQISADFFATCPTMISLYEKRYASYYRYFKAMLTNHANRVLRDTDLADLVATEVLTKMYKNPTFVFDINKSHQSFLLQSTFNRALQHYNKYVKGKLVNESVFGKNMDSDGNVQSVMDRLALDADMNDQFEFEFGMAHNCANIQFDMLVDTIKKLYPNDVDFVFDAFGIRSMIHNDRVVYYAVSKNGEADDEYREEYKELAEKHGIANPQTIKTRMFRVRQKIREAMTSKMELSRFSDNQRTGSMLINRTDIDGSLLSTANYIDGVIDGEIKKYKHGKVVEISNYQNGVLEGSQELFFDNGSIRMKGQYLNGERHGTFKFYDKSGVIDQKLDYYKGEEGLLTMYENGKELFTDFAVYEENNEFAFTDV